MGKYADIYLKGDAWNIIEEGFSPDHNEVSESIFSLANDLQAFGAFLMKAVRLLKKLLLCGEFILMECMRLKKQKEQPIRELFSIHIL